MSKCVENTVRARNKYRWGHEMLNWKKQGHAVHAEVQFLDGSGGRIVIVDGAQNPKGAVVVAMGTKGSPVTTTPLAESLAQLRVQDTIDAYCLQARVFGQLNLPGVDLV